MVMFTLTLFFLYAFIDRLHITCCLHILVINSLRITCVFHITSTLYIDITNHILITDLVSIQIATPLHIHCAGALHMSLL